MTVKSAHHNAMAGGQKKKDLEKRNKIMNNPNGHFLNDSFVKQFILFVIEILGHQLKIQLVIG